MRKLSIGVVFSLLISGCAVIKTQKPEEISQEYWELAIQCVKDVNDAYKNLDASFNSEACVSVDELEQNEEEKIISVQIGLLMSSLMFILVVPGLGAEQSYTDLYEELKNTFGNNI